MQVALAAALGLGGAALLSTPAEAAAKPCTAGTWVLIAHEGTNSGTNPDGTAVRISWEGATGTRLTISGTTGTFNFAKAKLEYHTETFGKKTSKQRTTYRKTLKATTKFAGTTTGKFDVREKTAAGKATLQMTYTSPKRKVYAPSSLATAVRQGIFDSPVMSDGTFTCSPRRLVLTRNRKIGNSTIAHKATYRRA